MSESTPNKRAEECLKNLVRNSASLPNGETNNREVKALRTRLLNRDSGEKNSPPPEPFSIPNFELLEEIGRGGMGVVWKARQVAPVQREVAIKVLRPSLDKHLARFERERQALATLSHPNIAKILVAGRSDLHSYFVMEYLPGDDLVKHCSTRNLTLQQRLGLVLQVCQAIQHSHERGVIHRDLKPSNILVTSGGNSGDQVKVIDFGLALCEQGAIGGENRRETSENTLLGSTYWMSPEQAGTTLSPDVSIDKRADIFSLSAVLYQLVTGTPPVFPFGPRCRTAIQTLKAIEQQQPETPSDRIRKLASGKLPHFTPEANPNEVRFSRDLERVIMKGLENNPQNRYQEVQSLADDILAVQQHRPVAARKLTRSYRLQKWFTRNRKFVAAASAIFFLATTLTFLTIKSYSESQKFEVADKIAKAATAAATKANRTADKATRDSERSKLEFNRIDQLFQQGLQRISPTGRDYNPSKMDTDYLELVSSQLDSPDFPLKFGMQIAYKVASIWIGYERPLKAKACVSKYLENTAARKFTLEFFKIESIYYRCLAETNHLADGMKGLESTIHRYHKHAGSSLADLRIQRTALAEMYVNCEQHEKAIAYINEMLSETQDPLGKPDRETFDLLQLLAASYNRTGQWKLAIETWEEAKKLDIDDTPGDLIEIVCNSNLSDIHKNLGRYRQAAQIAMEALPICKKRFGSKNLRTLDLRKMIAVNSFLAGDKKQILQLRQILDDAESWFGNESRITLNLSSDLGLLLLQSFKAEECVEILSNTQLKRRQVLGEIDFHRNQYILASAMVQLRKPENAISILQQSFSDLSKIPDVRVSPMLEIAELLTKLSLMHRREIELLRTLHAHVKNPLPSSRVGLLGRWHIELLIARICFQTGNQLRSKAICDRLLRHSSIKHTNIETGALLLLTECHLSKREFAKAEQVVERILQMSGEGHLVAHHEHIALVYKAEILLENKPASIDVTRLLRKVLTAKQAPSKHQLYAQGLYGECLWQMNNSKLAETALKSAYKSICAATFSQPLNHWQVPRSAERLSRFYEGQGKLRAAKVWRDIAARQQQRIDTNLASFTVLQRWLDENQIGNLQQKLLISR